MSRPAMPESETPLVKRLREVAGGADTEFGEDARLMREAAMALSLAQTEIKGHMRVVDDLRRDLEEMTLSNRYHAEDSLKYLHRAEAAEARIAELEKDAARYRWLNAQYEFLAYVIHSDGTKSHRLKCGEPLSHWIDAAIDAALKSRA